MNTAKIDDNLPKFKNLAHSVLEDALKEAAADGIRDAKEHAPYLKGGLRSDSEIKRIGNIVWRISFWAEYARYQEFGGDSKRTIKNYTWPGVGKHFLKNAGDAQVQKLKGMFKKHSTRIRV